MWFVVVNLSLFVDENSLSVDENSLSVDENSLSLSISVDETLCITQHTHTGPPAHAYGCC